MLQHSIVFKVGQTQFGQPVSLTKEIDGTFTIIKQAVNQRDETDVIRGLDAQTIRNMIKAVDIKLTEGKSV
jgi:hypothetical protein